MFSKFFNKVVQFVFDTVRVASYKGSFTEFHPDGDSDSRKIGPVWIASYDCNYLNHSYVSARIGVFTVVLWDDGECSEWRVDFAIDTLRAYKKVQFSLLSK